ncbi:MAG: DDE-type integrase/transposase/recombinase, partial [Mariprofundaceae bacterium]|nr:DDE-type integrase/transposase/recombinase [Mariprofundaceae bacterium]
RYPLPKKVREKAMRYEHQNPGDLGHIDIKKLPNIKGEDAKDKRYKIALLDDHTRLCYEERIPNKSAKTASEFLHRALVYFRAEFKVDFKAIITDNGKEFTCHSKHGRPKHKFEKAMAKHHLKHKYTRPYRPQTNGKIERFWRIWNEECWQRETFVDWQHYDAANTKFMCRYNCWRRHGGMARVTPIQRLKDWRKKKLAMVCKILQAVAVKSISSN